MADITMCQDKMCPLYTKCYRAQAIPNPYRQSYFYPVRKWNYGCNDYVPMERDVWLDLQDQKLAALEDGQKQTTQPSSKIHSEAIQESGVPSMTVLGMLNKVEDSTSVPTVEMLYHQP